MPPRRNHTDDAGTPTTPDQHSFERYSNVKTGTAEIIYDSECDSAWIQASHSVHLDEWR